MTAEIGSLTAGAEYFMSEADSAIATFLQNKFFARLLNGTITLDHYVRLLRNLYYQTRNGPLMFALAACNCSLGQLRLRDYLLMHADEEKTHHQWILDDLSACGVADADEVIRSVPDSSERYIAYNQYIATTFPLGRLGIAYVLESLGGRFGAEFATQGIRSLGLRKEQATFFFSHGTTDAKHMNDVAEMIKLSVSVPEEWHALARVARNAANLYAGMYDEAAQ